MENKSNVFDIHLHFKKNTSSLKRTMAIEKKTHTNHATREDNSSSDYCR
jgi:hypothetical protein